MYNFLNLLFLNIFLNNISFGNYIKGFETFRKNINYFRIYEYILAIVKGIFRYREMF